MRARTVFSCLEVLCHISKKALEEKPAEGQNQCNTPTWTTRGPLACPLRSAGTQSPNQMRRSGFSFRRAGDSIQLHCKSSGNDFVDASSSLRRCDPIYVPRKLHFSCRFDSPTLRNCLPKDVLRGPKHALDPQLSNLPQMGLLSPKKRS